MADAKIDESCCPCANDALACHAIASCNVQPVIQLYHSRVTHAARPVAAFLEGVVIYTLSQQWDDLISIYGLRLHPIPYCSDEAEPSSGSSADVLVCTSEAPARDQFRYTAFLLLITALLQSYAEVGPLPYRWHAWRSTWMRVGPRIIGMCLGWALGKAFKIAFLTMDAQEGWRGSDEVACTTPACNLGNVGVASLASLVTAFAMLLTQPIAAGRLGCGVHPCLLAASCYLRVVVLLLVNALSVSVRILWAVSFKGFLTWGVTAEQRGTVLYERALMLWAISLAATFAAATVLLRRWREWLDHYSTPASELACATHLDLRSLCSQFLSIMESAFGWVVGCAFTECATRGSNPCQSQTVAVIQLSPGNGRDCACRVCSRAFDAPAPLDPIFRVQCPRRVHAA